LQHVTKIGEGGAALWYLNSKIKVLYHDSEATVPTIVGREVLHSGGQNPKQRS